MQFQHQQNVSKFLMGYLHNLSMDIPEEKMLEGAGPTTNPPAWILGHLAVMNDNGLKLLGQPTVCPDAWAAHFGTGSKPGATKPDQYPTKQQLLLAIEQGHQALTKAAGSAPQEMLVKPANIQSLDGTPLETVGDVVTLLLTAHFGIHLGQLSTWRRLHGFPPLF